MTVSTPAELPSEPASRRWKDVLISGLLVACGWILFERGVNPGVGLMVASAKFGWNDFLTAFWLRKRDPDRDRSAACFWFFLASGLWKVTVVAFFLSVVIAMVANNAKQAPRKFIGGSVLLTVSGLALLTIVPVIGAVRARQGRVKIWVNGSLHAFRRRNMWPVWPAGRNNARGLLLAALILPLLVTLVLVKFGGPSMASALFAEALVLWLLSRGIVAKTPDEAWGSAWDPDFFPEEPPEDDFEDDLRESWAQPSLADG